MELRISDLKLPRTNKNIFSSYNSALFMKVFHTKQSVKSHSIKKTNPQFSLYFDLFPFVLYRFVSIYFDLQKPLY